VIYAGEFYSSEGDIVGIRFGLSRWFTTAAIDPSVSVAIDNIMVMPEPGMVLLLDWRIVFEKKK